jgi:V8-like Glu-specific endopeptidase
MRLTGRQYQQLTEALVDAFPEPQKLAQMVRFRLEKNLNAIAMGDDLTKIVFKLIGTAEAEAWVDQLIAAARESNPGNPRLFVFAQELHLATPTPSGLSGLALEKIIKKTNKFLDVNTWRERLGEIEAQVCRIEIIINNGREFGTGFLVAPNAVITNYHVMEAVIKGQAAPKDVILRFDYKQLGDRTIINQGTEYRLAEDWLIDKSPYVTENRLPTPDELDYALLLVDGVPGEERIGKNPEPGSPARGWIKLPTEPYEFLPNTPLLILQHPKAEPLKLAFDTDAIIGVNQNSTTVTYRTNTEPGSSGSPCFDIEWKLVALHHSGDPDWRNPTYNAGTPLSAIRSRLEKQDLWTDLLSNQPI